MRCDANVSVRKKGETGYRTRVEIKNLNSFRFLKQAIEYEVDRQIRTWEEGGQVEPETRQFDAQAGVTRAMRAKSEAEDYRYFPEPDLPPLRVDEAFVAKVRESLPELPREKAARFQRDYQLSAYDASVLVADKEVADYYEGAVEAYGGSAKTVANWVINEVLRLIKESPEGIRATRAEPAKLAALLRLLDEGKINAPSAKTILEQVHQTGADPEEVMRQKGLEQVSDVALIEAAVEKVVAAHPKELETYRGGKKALFGFFMGQVMKELRGQGDPKVVQAALRKALDG